MRKSRVLPPTARSALSVPHISCRVLIPLKCLLPADSDNSLPMHQVTWSAVVMPSPGRLGQGHNTVRFVFQKNASGCSVKD